MIRWWGQRDFGPGVAIVTQVDIGWSLTTAFRRAVKRRLLRLVRLSHCLVKLVWVSGRAGYARQGLFVKNQHHESLVRDAIPLTREAVV